MSPYAPDWRFLNRRVPMLNSAIGRAYFAYCKDVERDIVLKALRALESEAGALAKRMNVDRLVESIRAKRYATVTRPPASNARSFAIPILSTQSGAALGSVAMFYFGSAMTETEATGKYLGEMYALAERIACSLSERYEDCS